MRLTGRSANAQGLRKGLFSYGCRPSLRWLRTPTEARSIPCVRIGHLVFFDVEMVRDYLAATGVDSAARQNQR